MLLCSRLLSSSKICLKDVEEPGKERGRRPRRYQTHPWLAEERRRLYGHYARLMEELRVEDPQSFFNYPRMEPAMFDAVSYTHLTLPTKRIV